MTRTNVALILKGKMAVAQGGVRHIELVCDGVELLVVLDNKKEFGKQNQKRNKRVPECLSNEVEM